MKKILLPTLLLAMTATAGAILLQERYSAPRIMAAAEETPNYVPDRATNLSASFQNGELTGTISFDAPAKMLGGNAP